MIRFTVIVYKGESTSFVERFGNISKPEKKLALKFFKAIHAIGRAEYKKKNKKK